MKEEFKDGRPREKENPVVIVSGASRGLGAAAAKIASRAGARVVLCARSEQYLKSLATDIFSKEGQALAIPADVSIPDDCQRVVSETVSLFGRIDALINNAGVLEPVAPISDWDPDGWKYNFTVNLLGAVMLVQAALPFLRERSGRVINVSSGAAINPMPGWGAYCSSKAALNQFTRVLAAEEEKITTVALRPGVIDTEMQATIRILGQAGMHQGDYSHFVNLHTEGKLLPPEVPARAAVTLSLYATPEMSGEFVSWDDKAVQDLIFQHFTKSSH